MALLSLNNCFIAHQLFHAQAVIPKRSIRQQQMSPFPLISCRGRQSSSTCAAFFGIDEDPIVKEALKEPIAFLGGFVSGILRLDVKEDPLREWVERTADAAGLKDVDEEDMEEDSPQEIQIE